MVWLTVFLLCKPREIQGMTFAVLLSVSEKGRQCCTTQGVMAPYTDWAISLFFLCMTNLTEQYILLQCMFLQSSRLQGTPTLH